MTNGFCVMWISEIEVNCSHLAQENIFIKPLSFYLKVKSVNILSFFLIKSCQVLLTALSYCNRCYQESPTETLSASSCPIWSVLIALQLAIVIQLDVSNSLVHWFSNFPETTPPQGAKITKYIEITTSLLLSSWTLSMIMHCMYITTLRLIIYI